MQLIHIFTLQESLESRYPKNFFKKHLCTRSGKNWNSTDFASRMNLIYLRSFIYHVLKVKPATGFVEQVTVPLTSLKFENGQELSASSIGSLGNKIAFQSLFSL